MDIEKTIRALTGRGFAVQHFATGREAADYLDGAIDGTTVGIGGSKTIDQIGLYDRLTKHNTVWWHWRTPGFDTLDHALTAPVYLSSANAITADGQILNIDGRGNRLAAMVYGIGKTVYIVAGTNKICPDFDSALSRARNTAAVQNMQRFDGDQPYVSKTVPLDAAVTRYTSVSFSQVNSWRRAAVLDGVKADGRMLTQVIGYDEASDRLISPLSNEENATDRPTAAAAVSRDVNKDGILEIPTAELTINGSETTADSTGYVITWNTYSLQDNTLTPVCTSILNTAENYNLFLPSSEDNYGCQNDTVTRTATFFTYTQIGFNGNYLGREDKFSIRVYTEEDWAKKEQDDEDILLSSSAGRVYVLRILDDSMAESDEKTLQSGFEVLE